MKKNKPVQYLTREYVERTRNATPDQIIRFLEDGRKIYQAQEKQESILISMRVPSELLDAFKAKSEVEGQKYQTQIKKLMETWLKRK